MTAAELRAAFPVLERTAYLNAGTCGPLAAAAVEAAAAELRAAAAEGRSVAHYHHVIELHDRLRAAYAGVLGAAPQDVALTTSTSDGIVRVLAGLGLRAGDEVVTADDEHPGLLGPLGDARRRLGVRVRSVPLHAIADAAGPETRLIACSHVSWMTGEEAPAALAEVGRDIPVLLDGAQGAGAVPADVGRLGCAFYAAAGQKWLCGPIGTGMLHVAPRWRERLAAAGPTTVNLADHDAGLDAVPHPDARAYDASALSAEASALAVAAHDVLAGFGLAALHARAADLAARLADELRERGREVAERGRTTLVSWADDDPVATRDRLGEAGVVIRDLPGGRRLRASVGAWNDESDLERLLAAL